MGTLQLTLRPSQWTNSGWILSGIIGISLSFVTHIFFLILPLFALFKIIELHCWRYDFYDEVIIERKGIFNVTHKELYYHRIKSVMTEEPLLYQLVDIGNIHLISSDKYTSNFTFTAIPLVKEVSDQLRLCVKDSRTKNNIRELDLYNM